MGIVSKLARKLVKKPKPKVKTKQKLEQKPIQSKGGKLKDKTPFDVKVKNFKKSLDDIFNRLDDHHYGGQTLSKAKYNELKSRARAILREGKLQLPNKKGVDKTFQELLDSNYEDQVRFSKGGDTPKKKTKSKDAIGIMIAVGKVKKGKAEMAYGGSIGTKKYNYAAGGSVKNNLKPVPQGSKGKGLSKLPTQVRNKMGFMKKGGMVKK